MKASSRWASKESPPPVPFPFPFPAAFQRRLASASRRGATRANSTSSQKNPPLMPPCSSCPHRKCRLVWTRARRSRSFSLAAADRPLLGGGVAQLLVRGPLVEQLQEVSAGLGALAQRGGHDLELIGRELPVVQGLGQVRVLGGPRRRGQTSLGRPGRGARERPEPLSRRSVASPRVLPGLDHLGREEGHPRGRQPLGLAEQGHELAGRSARQRDGDRTPHDVTDEPDRLLDIGHQDRLGGRWRFGWECR